MTFEVINNPAYKARMGFTRGQFRKLDDLYCRMAGTGVLTYRTVECDFDEGIANYTYYRSEYHAPALQFIIRKIGPRDMMYEVYKQGKGLITKSGVFDRAFEKLLAEVESLTTQNQS
ncbi:MAG: hypothetical protein IT559_08065 [Alphaproteobacteria bacterium]|nr:hypothetical protein [Alphaproteobacteria bacterium]